MVYKKYIKRDGKVFGPYYYESYREGGKVKTRFISGPSKGDQVKESLKGNRNYFIFGFIFLFVLSLIVFVSYVKTDEVYTGRAFSGIEPYGAVCIPKPICETDWSDCYDEDGDGIGIKAKSCIDRNNCIKSKDIVEKCSVDTGESIVNGGGIREETYENEEDEIYASVIEEIKDKEESERLVCGKWSECKFTFNPQIIIKEKFGIGVQSRICSYENNKKEVRKVCESKKEIRVERVDEEVLVFDVKEKKKVFKLNFKEIAEGFDILNIEWYT